MSGPVPKAPRPGLRAGTDADIEGCAGLWREALESRDGRPVASGVDDRARSKLAAARVCFLVAGDDASLDGFVLVSAPGSGFAADPPAAAYLSLLAVRPTAQGRGLATRLLAAAEREASRIAGEAVLHVLVENLAARALYARAGWSPSGDPVPHPLSGAPMLTFRRLLAA